MSNTTVSPSPRRLTRGDGPLGGVSAGLADYFDVDVTLVRLGLVAATVIGFPTVPIAYGAAWLIIPGADGQTVGPSLAQAPAAPPPPAPGPPAPAPAAPPPPAPTAWAAPPPPAPTAGPPTGADVALDEARAEVEAIDQTAELPDLDTLEIGTADLDTPKADTPETGTADLDTPETDTPEAEAEDTNKTDDTETGEPEASER